MGTGSGTNMAEPAEPWQLGLAQSPRTEDLAHPHPSESESCIICEL
jgi:hypothetical protein